MVECEQMGENPLAFEWMKMMQFSVSEWKRICVIFSVCEPKYVNELYPNLYNV